ncbi:Hypothetical Protein FCC1311_111332 [Hondaea fermentalgiana]|uniref:Cilia- and flagella-associated protein 69 ARM repeats domain-containing protein n=1 Tax=Hondaea fermentalgiana TaxID=2315210 RepID=A0A2R5GVN9_9STRA|nr:Hypothetical Protein FCC1311_111332 [Hondaea fermentalgiana]|eukprot:GBG34910.1 Hypothetical Protein FCC1311_111332 [Hondaea fermentalgiana]
MEALVRFLGDELTQDLRERRREEIARAVGPALFMDECDAFVELLPHLEMAEAPQTLQRIEKIEARTPHARARFETSIGSVLVVLCELLSGSKAIATASAQLLTRFARQENGWIGALFARYGAMDLVDAAVAQTVDNLNDNDVDGDGRISSAEYERAQVSAAASCDVVALMDLVQALAVHRENALNLTRANVPNMLVEVVSRVIDFRKDEIRLMIQILWSVLEHSTDRLAGSMAVTRMQLLDKFRHANALARLGNPSAVGMLCSLMERMLLEGHRTADKQLRNEVLIIAAQLASRDANLPLFKSSGFLSLLLLYASAAEHELPTGCDPRHHATADPLDLEFKLLTWHTLRRLARDAACRPVIDESLFVDTLRGYVLPGPLPQRVPTSPYSLRQRETLRLHALDLLAALGPQDRDQLVALDVVRCAVGRASFDAPETGFAVPVVIRDEHHQQEQNELVQACLRVALHCQDLPEDLYATVDLLVYLIETSSSEEIREAAALVLTRMGSAAAPALKETGGIRTVAAILLTPDRAALRHQETCVIAGLACAHACIVNDPASERVFIEEADGIERVLDLIDGSVVQVQGQSLALLADLLANNPQAVPIALHYKSSTPSKADALSLILDLWVSKSCTEALITDLERPLGNANASSSSSSSPPQIATGPRARLLQALNDAQALMLPDDQRKVLSAADAVEMRDRISALLESLELDKHGSFVEELSHQRRVILSLAQQYKAFCHGERWFDLGARLQRAKVRPVFYDRAFLDARTEDAVALAQTTQEDQLAHCAAEEAELAAQDGAFYGGIETKQKQRVAAQMVKATATKKKLAEARVG